MSRRFNDRIDQEIADRYEKGDRCEALAEEYGCDPRTIINIAKRHGKQIGRRGGTPFSPGEEVEREIVRRYLEGESQTAIGAEFGIHQGTVSNLLRRLNVPTRKTMIGKHHGAWKGGRMHTADGYVRVWIPTDHPMAEMRTSNGYVFEHRLVMAEMLGRPLQKGETVHHKDGNRAHNAPENLQLRQGRHGIGVVMCCARCGSTDLAPAPIQES